MQSAHDIALSVKDLKTYFYTNNRCNKAINGVSFEIRKGKRARDPRKHLRRA